MQFVTGSLVKYCFSATRPRYTSEVSNEVLAGVQHTTAHHEAVIFINFFIVCVLGMRFSFMAFDRKIINYFKMSETCNLFMVNLRFN